MKSCLLFFLSACMFFSCVKEEENGSGFELKKGDSLPDFTISNSKESVSTSDLQNKTSLIIFFSTTCGDCRQALPDIQELYDTYRENPSVRILLIARGQTEAEVQESFGKAGYTMEFFADPEQKIYSLFAGSIIPRLFLAGKDGKINLTQTEYVNREEVVNAIGQLSTAG